MQLTSLAVSLFLTAEPSSGACPNGVLAAPGLPPAETLTNWPTEKLNRPLSLPRGVWGLGTSAVYSGLSATGGTRHAAGATLGVTVAPVCNLELGVETAHLLTPAVPFTTVAPGITLALTRSIAATLGANLHVQPDAVGTRFASAWLGAPVRWRLSEWFGLVGFDRLLIVSTRWGGVLGDSSDLSLSVPVGVLLQPLQTLSLEARVVPVATVSVAVSKLEFHLEALFAPLRTLDVVLSGFLSPGAGTTLVVLSAGVRLRL